MQGRYGTDIVGCQEMLAAGRRFTHRVWAVEGCGGISRHIAQRLVPAANESGRATRRP